jgi:asparagine synthase (glutamine-hydrolysing)
VLFALADARGASAAADSFAHATRSLGEPRLRLSSGSWMVGAWGRDPSLRGGPNFVQVGRLDLPGPEAGDSLARFAGARGDFALLGADEQGLLLASGQGGGYRPIYAAVPGDGRVLASTSFELLRAATNAPLDPEVLAAYATAATMFVTPTRAPERTLFGGIRRLPMYEAWHAGLDGTVRRRESFRPLSGPEDSGDPAELSSVFREAFRAAVRRGMDGHAVVGVLVGGGLDSSSTLAVSADVLRREGTSARLETFAWDYATFHGDDRPYLRALARHLHIEPFRTTACDAGKALGTTFVADGMPLYQALSPYLAAMSPEATRRDVTVLLDGAGGDEIADGDPRLFSELASSGHPLSALVKAVRLRGPHMGGPGWRVREYVIRPLIRGAAPTGIRRRRYRKGLAARYPWAGPRLQRYLDEIADAPPTTPPGIASTPADRFEAFARSPYLFQCCVGRAQEETLTGCTRRDPFFDEDFMRAVARLPPLALLQGDFRRGLLRQAMRDLMPDEVRWRRTKAVMEPALSQMVEAAGGFRVLDGLGHVRLLADLGIAEPRAFRRSLDELARDPDHGRWVMIWPALAAEAFLRSASAS